MGRMAYIQIWIISNFNGPMSHIWDLDKLNLIWQFDLRLEPICIKALHASEKWAKVTSKIIIITAVIVQFVSRILIKKARWLFMD